MSYPQKILTCVILIILLFFNFLVPPKAYSYEQSAGVCYSQCAAYKFYWNLDECYYHVQSQCSMGGGGGALKAISFLKTAVQMCRGVTTEGGMVDVATPLKALFCYEIIKTCIEPKLNACEDTCRSPRYLYYYAPNLTVTSSWFNVQAPGLYYDEADKRLRIDVLNNGAGYAWDIRVTVSYGTTKNQDRIVSGGGTIFDQTLTGLTFWGAAQAGHETALETTKDFLIDESRFAKYLQDYKSDKDYPMIPSFFETSIPFEAKDGEYTKVIINVDPDKMIPETNESDNTYILEIDKLPDPAAYQISNIKAEQTGSDLGDYNFSFDLKNTGELSGRATIALTEGYTTNSGKVTFFQDLNAGETKRLSRPLHFDVNKANDVCSLMKQIIITVTDEQNKSISSSYTFPLYAGRISGRITNSSGKPIKGATITLSTGQTATSGDYGFYHITGISKLGKLTMTVKHTDYTETQTRDVDMSLTIIPPKAGQFSCDTQGLTHDENFVLRDMPLKLHLRLKSTPGPLVNGKVIFTGGAGTVSYDVPGEKEILEMNPGQFRLTAMAPSYVTKDIQVVLTPPEQTIEILMEPLWGRETDEGLTLITPVKLWERTIETGKIDAIAGAKNGKLLIVNTNDSKPAGGIKNWTGKLTFINPIDGSIIKSDSVPFNVGQSQVELDSSYDGRTVGFTYAVRDPEEKTRTETFVKIFNAAGSELGTTSLGKSRAVMSEVSPDGFFLYPHQLMNSSLYKYTRKDIEGIGDGRDFQTYSAGGGLHFLRDNNLVAGCKEGQCVLAIADKTVRVLGKPKGGSAVIDSSFDGQTIITRNYRGLSSFSGNLWDKDLESDAGFLSAAVTPGGEYIIAAKGPSGSNSLAVFDKNGNDVTPKFEYKNVRYVEANDRGLFFSEVRSNKLAYYQVGRYSSDYNPPSGYGLPTGQAQFGDFQIYVNTDKRFEDLNYLMSWDRIGSGALYRPKNDMTIANHWGKLTVGKETVFTRDASGDLVLLWGQLEVDSNTPIKVTVIKNKLNDPETFVQKLDQLFGGTLSQDEYVVINNLHTKYLVQAKNGIISVSVKSGEVETTFNKQKTAIKEGIKLTINEKNVSTVSKTGLNPYHVIAIAIVVLGIMFIEVRFRKSSWLQSINESVKRAVLFILSTIVKILKSIIIIIINIIKSIIQKLIHQVKK